MCKYRMEYAYGLQDGIKEWMFKKLKDRIYKYEDIKI
jgi:hypothetical protein